MRINAHQHARKFRTPLLAPHPAKAQEEALLGSVAINVRPLFAAGVLCDQLVQRHERDAGPAVIGGVLAQSEATVEF